MKRSEFLRTVRGQESACFKRRLKQLYLEIKQEPETKKISNAAAQYFRKSVRDQMRKQNRLAFTGDIVIEIHFHSTAKVPQPVQTLVKNYLDLLHKEMPEVDQLRRILFNDDNQVKLLVAHQYNGSGPAQIFIKAYRFSSFVKDVEYVDYIHKDNFSDSNYRLHGDFEMQKQNTDFYPTFNEAVRAYNRHKTRVSNLPHELALILEDNLKRDVQEAYLKQNELKIEQLLEYLEALFDRRRKISEVFNENKLLLWLRDNMFIGLDFIPMGGAPIKEGQSKIFRKHISQQLADFKKQHSYLFPLLRPVGLTIVVIPPAYRCPDADNLARQIVPFFDQICQPPTTYTISPGLPTSRKEKVRIAILSYQILYLPRCISDPEDGKIMVLFDKDFISTGGLWAKIDDVIKKWEDHIKYKYY